MPRTATTVRRFACCVLLGLAAVAQAASEAPRAAPALNGLIPPRVAKDDDFLPPEQAFVLEITRESPGRARLHWQIAPGYYLYRNRVSVEAANPDTQLGAVTLPEGLPHEDEFFGPQQIYRDSLTAGVALSGAGAAALKITYQGCADAGLCYPPQVREVTLAAAGSAAAAGSVWDGMRGFGDHIQRLAAGGNRWAQVLFFFGWGLLLAFTPCVLPMVPILSGIIVGEGERLTPARSFLLSVAYVLGMAVTYTLAGALAALAGSQVQAFFQKTWIIVLFAGLFVTLAFAMFGAYELQMPAALQTRFASASQRIKGGKMASTALMGALSSLVVTACVAPPLVAAAALISQSGDVVRGATAFFALSIGMGVPLLVVGASAGRLLPKAGPWMDTVKGVFGVMFLGVAVWLLDRVVPPRATLAAWGLVAFALAWVVTSVGLKGGRRTPARFALGTMATLYGAVLLVGATLGGTDPLRPFAGTGLAGAGTLEPTLPFQRIHNVVELDAALAAAQSSHQRTMLDFYADWCVSCKEMEKDTFRDPMIRAALKNYVLLQADVTANGPADQALLHRFHIFGPPTTAFFAPDGRERPAFRLVGYANTADFAARLAAFEQAE
jgi:thioredoxin:protein disulfide reductase